MLAGVASFAFAGAQVSREYDLKAVFLYNFAAFVEWPPAAFEEPDAPFVVGVVGADPFGAVLDEIVANEFVGSHRIEIRRLDRGDELAACHIVFISGSEGRRVQSILRRVENLPVLTVSDLPHFVDYGGMIGFIRENDQLELVINTEAMRAGQLIASSKLLELAQIVDVAGLEP